MNKKVEISPDIQPGAAGDAERPATVDSAALLGPSGELVIVHRGERYVLRVTRQGKLLLNK